MQTFLPFEDFEESADALDWRRLGKQRVETYQIMSVLLNRTVANTTRQVDTGRTKLVYFDHDGEEILWDEEHDARSPDEFYTEEVPILKAVATDPSEWRLHVRMGTAWENHPAVKMWEGYEWLLMEYQKAVCAEWVGRGYRDTCFQKTMFLFMPELGTERAMSKPRPTWLGNRDFHLSHQSNLIRKDPDHYVPIFGHMDDSIPYYWPTEQHTKELHSNDELR